MKQFLNGNIIANDVRMRRSVWQGAFLLVEGASDEKLYGIFVNAETCQIVIAHGRDNVIEACDTLNVDRFEGFLGITDADFAHVQERVPEIDNLVVTDFHDAECYMLRGAAFDRVIDEFASKDKIKYWRGAYQPDIREHFVSHSLGIGLLLWHSNAKNWNLVFSNLETKEFIDRESLELDITRLIEHVKNKSRRHDLDTAEALSEITKFQALDFDPWQIVRGPDIIDLMGLAFRHALGTWSALDVSHERLQQSLRLAYGAEEFASTNLFAAIKKWEEGNRPYVILNVIGTRTLFPN